MRAPVDEFTRLLTFDLSPPSLLPLCFHRPGQNSKGSAHQRGRLHHISVLSVPQ